MHKIFSFKGVTRSGDNMLATEGECIGIVNMRMKEGSLVPLPSPVEEARLEYLYSGIFRHEMTGHYLCITDDSDAVLHVYDEEWKRCDGRDGKPLLSGKLRGVRNVEFLGYVACCMTIEGIVYLIYNDGCYHCLGERPPMPSLDIKVSSKLSQITTDASFYVTPVDELESSWQYNSKGYFDELISTLNIKGYYIDRALFKFALRTFDGSYICISPAMYVCDEGRINGVSRDGFNMAASPVSDNNQSRYNVYTIGFKPEFELSGIELGDWKNIVVGVDVFTTGSIMGKKVDKMRWSNRNTGSAGEPVFYEAYVDKDFDELCNDVLDARYYYRIAEYDIEGNLVDELKDVSQTNLVLQQTLENGACSYTSVAPGCSYVFNNRLHAGALKEFFCKGYDPVFLKGQLQYETVTARLKIMTRINTFKGESAVVRDYGDVVLMKGKGGCELPPLLSYPDTRAFEMVVYAYVGQNVYCRTFTLTPHRYLNQAQYLNRWSLGFKVSYRANLSGGAKMSVIRDKEIVGMFGGEAGVYELVYSKEDASWMYNGVPYPPEEFDYIRLVQNWPELADGDSIVFTITACGADEGFKDICNIAVDDTWTPVEDGREPAEKEPYEMRHNVLKVSAVDNPFLFPLQCTYTPSQGEILAVASNTVALSQGQFGQHPLYLFCSDGVWAMAVDTTGGTAYLASYPLSREVCVNRDSVCGIDGGVVFVGLQGVMMLSGGKMKNLSTRMEGDTGRFSAIASNRVVRNIFAMMRLPDVVSNDDFAGFVADAAVAYMPAHDEIMFSNPSFAYSYIYSLRYGTWSHLAHCVAGFVKGCSLSRMFAHKDGKSVVMRDSGCFSGENRVLVLTRPQLWGSKLPKRIMQLMLHATARPVQENDASMPVLACYMFGSNDGVNFKLLAGKETGKEMNDLKFPYFPTQAYSCYLFAVCGELSANSRITGIDIDVEAAWNSRR